jgi:exodeoxyribonuclease V alpha subunit
MQALSGSIEHITYSDEDSLFVVATLRTASGQDISIVGIMPSIQVGETVKVEGEYKRHPKHGLQFEVKTFEFELPKDAKAIEKFLAAGAIRGIGPGFAKKIVSTFSEKTLDVIEKEPHLLKKIRGLGESRAEAIAQAWKEHKATQEIFLFLSTFGISRTYARKILRTWGAFAIQKIRQNPYLLAKEINGIGFIKADAIAKTTGFAHEATERIDAGIDFALYELSQEGHVCSPIEEFIERAQKLLSIDSDKIRLGIGRLYKSGALELRKKEDTLTIWSKPLFVCECGIALEIRRLRSAQTSLRKIDKEKAVLWAEEKQKIKFAKEQKLALLNAIEEKFLIITGGPGTGKSTITKALVSIFEKLTPKVLLVAPTGRAARRLAEITCHYASTIHRLLKYDFTCGKFKHDREHPVESDLIIIDEASMIDTPLMYSVLKAIPDRCKVVLIGDADQLPSIGPGNVLRDLIASQKVPTTKLEVIFRQAHGSKIITNAHRINEGKMPFCENEERSDFQFFQIFEAEKVREAIIELATSTIPKKYGFDTKKDIQVLAPMRKGPCGIEILNKELQEKLCPCPSTFFFRVGDKVIQMKNNYAKEVFNGDIGFILSIDHEAQTLLIDFEENQVSYDFSELDELALAYAVSVHKYQGSEAKAIIMPIHTAHFKMLSKNLLYTAVTRGKKLVYLVGTKKALAIAVKTENNEWRGTGLKWQLEQAYDMGLPAGAPLASSSFNPSGELATSTIP